MSVSKFVEGFNKVVDDRIAKAEANVEATPYPLEELKKIQETLPDSPIAKRYGGNGVIDKDTTLYAAALEQDKELVKRLGDGEKAMDKFMAAKKLKRESDPEKLLTNLYSNVYSLLANSSALGAKFTMQDLLDLSPKGFASSYDALLEEADAMDLDLPVSVDPSLILEAFKELYKNTVAPEKGLAGSPINESEETKAPEATASPISEGEAEKPEAETSTTTSTATTSTPGELPKEAPKATDEKTTSVNVTVETPPAPAPPVPNVTVESTAPQTTNVTSTQQSVINEGEKKGETKAPETAKKSPLNIPKAGMSMSELLSMSSETTEKSSLVVNDNYYALLDEMGLKNDLAPKKEAASPVNASSLTSTTSEETSETTSETNNNLTTNTNQTSVINNDADALEKLYESKVSTSTQKSVNSLQTEVSKKAPMLSKTEAPLSKPQEASSPKSAESAPQQQSQISESPAAPAAEGTANAPAPTESAAAPSTGEAPKASGGGGGMDTSEMENRLARIERVLSGPLDVRVIS